MRIEKMMRKDIKNISKEVKLISNQLLVKGGYIQQTGSGLYNMTTLGFMVQENIKNIIREEMLNEDAQEVLMSLIMTKNLWDETGRYESIGDEMMRFSDRKGSKLLLGMTHEEAAVNMMREYVNSYKQIGTGMSIFQFQTKVRDEARSRGGLIRTREFIMKDCYSFHLNENDLDAYYESMKKAYIRIFKRVGIKNLVIVKGDSGMMGGKISHEFMLECENGEDRLKICTSCGYGENAELGSEACAEDGCGGDFRETRGIEIGNIFQLGDFYSTSMNYKVSDDKGQKQNVLMGCYGIGLGRLVASIVEDSYDEHGIVWNKEVAAFNVHIMNLKDKEAAEVEKSERIYQNLRKNRVKVLIDGTNARAGSKFSRADLIGANIQVIVSDKELVEVRTRDKKVVNFVKEEDVITTVEKMLDVL